MKDTEGLVDLMENSWCIRTASESAFVESLLQEASIPYFIHNGHFGSLMQGCLIQGYNDTSVLVAREFAAEARLLLSEVLEPETVLSKPGTLDSERIEPEDGAPAVRDPTSGESTRKPAGSAFGRFRVLVELLLAGWIVPGNIHKSLALRGAGIAMLMGLLLLVGAALFTGIVLSGSWTGDTAIDLMAPTPR